MAKIYTDGSCLKNPGGPGGWSFCLLEKGEEWRVSGGDMRTTNNRMEMQAVIEALRFAQNTKYTIYTDSQLVLKCAQGIWRRKKNLDLWKEYDQVSEYKQLVWIWIKGHSGDRYNDIVDSLAKEEAKKCEKNNLG